MQRTKMPSRADQKEIASQGLSRRSHEKLPKDTKQVIHGTPITPASSIARLKPTSFCISYWNRRPLTPYLNKLGPGCILLIDNGAFSRWKSNLKNHTRGQVRSNYTDLYWRDFYAWALPILRSIPEAHLIIPDVIDGSMAENRRLILDVPSEIPIDRCIPVWHLGEDIDQLLWMVEGFGHIAFGSSGRFSSPGTTAWRQRLTEAFDAIEEICGNPDNGQCRPRIHLLRGLSAMKNAEFPFASADATNLARNFSDYENDGTKTLEAFQAEIESRSFPYPGGPIWPDPCPGPSTRRFPLNALQQSLFPAP
jgi:hypothetical protein